MSLVDKVSDLETKTARFFAGNPSGLDIMSHINDIKDRLKRIETELFGDVRDPSDDSDLYDEDEDSVLDEEPSKLVIVAKRTTNGKDVYFRKEPVERHGYQRWWTPLLSQAVMTKNHRDASKILEDAFATSVEHKLPKYFATPKIKDMALDED